MDLFRTLHSQFAALSHPQQPQPPVQILSDLHLEISNQYYTYTFPTSAPLLLLGGDIGRLVDYDGYLEFLRAQSQRYRAVFLVLGNHEFYTLTYDAGLEEARRLVAEPSLSGRVVLLHRARWDDPDSHLTLLGCTLWSAIRPDESKLVQGVVSDFKHIQGWTVDSHNAMHVEELAWLQDQVASLQDQDRRILVATHHAPCTKGTSNPDHAKKPWSSAFATDVLQGSGWSKVKTWVFGHTHYTTTFMRNGITVAANQRGYVFPTEKKRPKTNPDLSHEFDETKFVTV
ncbi:putative calcineurin-like phosphoesterase [Stachybotrys elegans]|uniref:Calcineurin-like phosphoesterase n=1 Tax=Stachybotrys elegans TaxID=80388 RepID=A0A8K0WS41_9HYPO|nr:putative calcineurin-like phosphoesterase [Stachybotrys elegans]